MAMDTIDLNIDLSESDQEPKFKIGDQVVEPNSGLAGTVVQVETPIYAYMGFQYVVVFANGARTRCVEDALQPLFATNDVFALCENRNFASYDDYMIVNTLFKIDNVNSNTISTLRASRTLFKAYQFKPLLKFFASPSRRILIADEVGLGKTIEAGHILLELKARKEFHNAIIVCPKSLREKWRMEMEDRFGIDFTIYGGEDNDGNKYPSMADLFNAYGSGHDVRAIINYERIRYRKPRTTKGEVLEKRSGFIEFILSNNIRHSVVICDESHRLRNESTLSYSGAEKLLERSDSAIFLTATPVMIKEDNLYNQMHLLSPEKYSNAQIFSNRMSQGRPFVFALSELCAGLELPKIWNRLQKQRIERIMQADTKFGTVTYKREMSVDESFNDDPVYQRIKGLFNASDSAKTRAALQMNLVKMSAIQNEFTRTTKRQIRNELSKVNNRFPCKVTISLTADEQRSFESVINDYEEHQNATGNASLGLVQIKRMLSSSVYAYCNDRADLDRGVDAFAGKPDAKVTALISEILHPSMSNHMREIKKVIVFAIFTDTLRYLKIRLTNLGVKCAIIDGSVADRQAIIDKFRSDGEIRVLLSSEVGSEGLDMQFCDTIVNYDLPWNPMVVEQRIGRIDRIGQLAENIYVYNFVVRGSITEDIYERLETRIGIFKGTIGDLEPILSAPYKDGQSILEAHNNIETRYYSGEISKEQALREEDLINQAIEAQRLTIEELNSELNKNTISMDSYYDEQIKLIQRRKAYVTDVELQSLLKRVLSIQETQCTQCRLEQSHECREIWELRIPQNFEDRDCLVSFLRRNRPRTSDSSRAYDSFINQIRGRTVLQMTFDQSVATENHQIIFVNNYSPLIQACNEFRRKSGMAVKKAFKMELMAAADRSGVLNAGDKFFLLNYQLAIKDVSKDNAGSIKELCPVLFDLNRETIVLDDEVIASVCSLAQDRGRETQMPSAEVCSPGRMAKFKALATQTITKIVAEKKRDIEEQSNVERRRWIREVQEFYGSKIDHYEGEIKRLEKVLAETERIVGASIGDGGRAKIKNELAGYKGTITKLTQDLRDELAKLEYDSKVSISREELSACYILVR